MMKGLFSYALVVMLIAATPASPEPQAAVANVVTAAIARINANDAMGLSALFTDDPTIIDEVPPFRWSGADAVAKWLSQSNAFAARDGLKTFTQSGSEILGFEDDKAEFDAAFGVSLSKKGRVACGKWVFVLQQIGDSWKIQEAVWTSLSQRDPDC
jgi:ketosteroid isomerase-like protein